jgi:hypothetical protein
MKKYPLDKTLHALERMADFRGLELESIPEYVSLCECLTCLEMGLDDQAPFPYDEIETVYRSVFKQVVVGARMDAMEFHRRCQQQ